MADQDDRLRTVEIGQAAIAEKLETIRHDASNTRTMLNAMSHTQDVRHTQLETDIKELSRVLFRIGLSLVGSIVTILIGIIAFFLLQQLDKVDANHDQLMQQQGTQQHG